MTAPINFPSISPPQLAQSKNQLAGLPELLLAITQGRQQLALRKQELAMEKQRTEASVAASGEQAAESKQDREQKKREFEVREQQLQAHEIVANALPGVITAPGDFAQNAEAERVRLIQSNKKLAPYINDAFNAQLKATTETRTAIANRRTAESTAKTTELTAEDRVKYERLQAEFIGQQLSNAKLTESIQKAELRYGSARVGNMLQAMTQGANAAQGARLAGIPLPEGVDPNFVFLDQTGTHGEAQRKAQSHLSMFEAGEQLVNQVGAVPLKFIGSMRTLTGSNIVEAFGNMFSGDQQQQLIAGYRLMANAFRFNISGQASAVAEEKRLAVIITPIVGDKPETILGKAQLRSAIKQAIAKTAGGELRPVAAMDNMIAVAKANKLPKTTMDILMKQRADAAKYENSPEYKQNAGTFQATPSDALGGDPAVTRRFITPSRP